LLLVRLLEDGRQGFGGFDAGDLDAVLGAVRKALRGRGQRGVLDGDAELRERGGGFLHERFLEATSTPPARSRCLIAAETSSSACPACTQAASTSFTARTTGID